MMMALALETCRAMQVVVTHQELAIFQPIRQNEGKTMLTNLEIRNARAEDKPRKLYDGSGLHLHISMMGCKSWRFKFSLD